MKRVRIGKVRFGIIGCGSVVYIAHMRAFQENADKAEVVATCDPSEERAKDVAKRTGAKAWYTDHKKLLKRDDVDAVLIASANYAHCEQGIDAAEAGAHAIIEKPLACTNREAWAIVNACRKAGVRLITGTNQRFWIQHEIAKQLVEQGALGKVVEGRSSLHETWDYYQGRDLKKLDRVAVSAWRVNPEEAGAATLFDQGSHRVDLVRWLLGSEVKRVVGFAKHTVTPVEYSPLDDVAWLLMEFENGSFGCASMDKISRAVSNITELYGTEGTIFTSSEALNPFQSVPLAIFIDKARSDELPEIVRKYRYPTNFWADDLFNERVGKPIDKRWITIYPPYEWSYSRMMSHFIDCLLHDKEPSVKPEDGARIMDVLCGVFKSMETGRWVDMPLREEVIPPMYRQKYKPPGEYL